MISQLLNFGDIHPFGKTIGRPRNLAWPVALYRITVPAWKKHSLSINIFENLVLNLLNITSSSISVDQLQSDTSLPKELLISVISRLQDRGYLDENLKVSSEKLSQLEDEKRENIEYVTVFAFRELIGMQLLPYFCDASKISKLINRFDIDELGLKEIKTVDGAMKMAKERVPSPQDVVKAFAHFQKHYGAYSETLLENQIVVVPDVIEFYHLVCPIAILERDCMPRIADPFGQGYSIILEQQFEKLLAPKDSPMSEWFTKWEKSLARTVETEDYESLIHIDEGNYPFLANILKPQYPAKFRTISQIFGSIEWALYYHCLQQDCKKAISLLKITPTVMHTELLSEASKKLGLGRSAYGITSIPAGKIMDFENGKAFFDTVLSIAVLQAANNEEEQNNFHKLVEKYPNLYERLRTIEGCRNAEVHGSQKNVSGETELADDPFMRELINILLPGITFPNTQNVKYDIDKAVELRLAARLNIQSFFGYSQFSNMSSNLQNRLFAAEQFFINFRDNENARDFIEKITAVFQCRFEEILSYKLPPSLDDKQILLFAQLKANEAGLGDLPKRIQSTRLNSVVKTLHGGRSTLGACTIAFLIMLKQDDLQMIAQNNPLFLSVLAQCIDLREHGNQTINMHRKELANLRSQAYSAIATLMEVL